MNQQQIKDFLASLREQRARTIVIVDYANVCKWNVNLKWSVGIPQLGNLVKHLSTGNKSLRRFYYGSDCGRNERPEEITHWSKTVLQLAANNGFELVGKSVKYIHDQRESSGFRKKCDLDVEMAVDLMRLHTDYDHIVIFSGDGDLVYALRHLKMLYGKTACVIAARGHIGKELVTARQDGFIQHLLFADDFESRLDKSRHRGP